MSSNLPHADLSPVQSEAPNLLPTNRQSSRNAKDLFISVMSLNHRLFTEGDCDAAYHALAAALHLVTITENENDMALVEKTANEQRVWMEQNLHDNTHVSVGDWTALASRAHHQAAVLSAILSSKSHLNPADLR